MVVAVVSSDAGAAPLQLSGTFVARRRATLSSELSGLVAGIEVEVGDQVNREDVLATLDDTLAKLDLASSEAAVEEARARAQDARRLAEETDALKGSGAVSSSSIATRRASAQETQAALQSRMAAARERRERVARHQIRAPFQGVIAERFIETGEWANTGDATFELVDTSEVWLEVQFPQRRFRELTADTPIEIAPDTSPDTPRPARLVAAVPVADPASRTMRLRLVAESKAGDLLPGASGTARFALAGVGGTVRVSRDALVRRPDGTPGVWIVTGESGALVAEARKVTVGRSVGEAVEIREGLQAGDRVVIRGNESLRQGEPVRPTSVTGSAGD